MRRWNGWGDTAITYPLPAGSRELLEAWVGAGKPPADMPLFRVVGFVPPSRLPDHPLVQVDPEMRVLHSRGQSLPDWVALRSGQIEAFPDGVAYPVTHEEVVELLAFARQVGADVIPYGGGTSVVGHINPRPGPTPTLTIDLRHLNRLFHFDEKSGLATFGAGVCGPDLEAQSRVHGFTLGHYPQSFEYSTLGGWVATRSSGQQSLKFGRIEQLFAGAKLASPAGTWCIPHTSPASAAGPNLHELACGSEGRLGIFTEITVRTTPLPEKEDFHAVFFPDFDAGREAARRIVQIGLPLSLIRLSTARETQTTLALAGHEHLIHALEAGLKLRGIDEEKALMMLGFTGRASIVKATRQEALGTVRQFGGVHVGRTFGKQWQKGRFHTPYLRNTLWEMGYAVDTLETATDWATTTEMVTAIEKALHLALADEGERVHVFTHLSHVYPAGSSVYTTYLFRLGRTPEHTLARWQKLKTAASEAIVVRLGTISHQHGVGTDHAPYLVQEKGHLGMAAIANLCHTFDPAGIMNPGKLLNDDSRLER